MASDAPINPVRIRARLTEGRIGGRLDELRSPAATAAMLVAVVVGAVMIARFAASGTNLVPTLGAVVGLVALAVAAALGHLRSAMFVGLLIALFVVPDVMANFGGSTAAVALVAGLAAISLLYASQTFTTITALDVAVFLIFVAASVLPAIVSGTPATIAGNGVLILGTYLVARVTAPKWDRLVVLLLVIGAIHGVVAILWAIPATNGLIPFVPLLGGEPNPSSRAVGLFNNPNTFGNLEAMIIVLALWSGVARRLWPLIVLCVIGLLPSGSREALLGLVVAVSLMVLLSPGRALGPVGALGLAAGIFIALVPNAQQRFDPSGYSGDSSLLERFELWDLAFGAIARSPIIGYGQTSGLRAVDQAYLNWLVDGGVLGTAIWVTAVILIFSSFPAWPVLVAMLVIGVLGNPFAGPMLALLLVLLAASHESMAAGASEKPSSPLEPVTSPAGL